MTHRKQPAFGQLFLFWHSPSLSAVCVLLFKVSCHNNLQASSLHATTCYSGKVCIWMYLDCAIRQAYLAARGSVRGEGSLSVPAQAAAPATRPPKPSPDIALP